MIELKVVSHDHLPDTGFFGQVTIVSDQMQQTTFIVVDVQSDR